MKLAKLGIIAALLLGMCIAAVRRASAGTTVNNVSIINVYPAGGDGNVSPIATLVGADTGLSFPPGMTLDSAGNLYALRTTTAA